jgi:late competence protein required for DNA uptake (superfamily II DNA/RNA helicase)
MDAGIPPRRERAFGDVLCTASPDLAQLADLARRFQAMIQECDVDALADWLA